jgi:hypothetical protein
MTSLAGATGLVKAAIDSSGGAAIESMPSRQ